MKNKSPLDFCYFISICFISLISFNSVKAQENGFFELKENNSVFKENSKKDKSNDRKEFYDLAYRLHPTSYVENNSLLKVKHDESSATKLTFNDTKSFNIFNQDNLKFKNIELITVKLKTINDLSNKLDLTDIDGLSNLIYIYI